MPYLKGFERERIEAGLCPATPGELNYSISKLIDRYLRFHAPVRYQHLNDVLGALQGAKLEFYRRIVVPYEDKKIIENGDIYCEQYSTQL